MDSWRIGLPLALTASICWGSLPIGLKLALIEVDPYTVTFFRFMIAAVLLTPYCVGRGQLKSWKPQGGFFVLAGVALSLNYLFFVWGLHFSTPANSQLFIQLSPMLFGLLSVWLFGDPFTRRQLAGLVVLLSGLALFYRDQVDNLSAVLLDYRWGCFFLFLAALFWAVYALCQKRLNRDYTTTQVLWVIFIQASFYTAPLIDLGSLRGCSRLTLAAILFCGLNTLVAYAAFAGAVAHWEAPRVSAVLPLTPIFTLLMMPVATPLFPGLLQPEQLDTTGYLGALLVVAGAFLTALARKSPVQKVAPAAKS